MVRQYSNVPTASTPTSNGHREHTKEARDGMIKTCEFCGKKFESSHNNKRFCSRKCQSQSWWKKKSAETAKDWQHEKSCKVCGKTFIPKMAHQLCCSEECSNINADNLVKMHMERKRLAKKELEARKLSLAEINKRAREEHLTYGKFCAKHGL